MPKKPAQTNVESQLQESQATTQESINRIPAGKFLYDSGLLFEINRTLLHPLGLALEVRVDGDNVTLGDLWDYRDDPEGMAYGGASFAEGRAKHNGMMAQWGYDRHQTRKSKLGFVVQEG